jgi:hypothetical protein
MTAFLESGARSFVCVIALHRAQSGRSLRRLVKRGATFGMMLCLFTGKPVGATEAGLFAGPIGGSDMRSAYLPQASGLYLGFANLDATYNVLDGNNGRPSAIHDSSYDAALEAFLGLYVYPWRPFGGTIATSVSESYDFLWERIGGTRKQADSGLNNTYSDLLVWSRYVGLLGAHPDGPDSPLPYGLTVSVAYSMVFSTGAYQLKNLTNEGYDYDVFIPNMALTYLTGPDLSFGDGTEISARLYYDMPTRNTADGYQSGDVFDIDWAVSERFGQLQAGLAGNYANQTTRDRENGVLVAPFGNELERATLGPVVQYDLPSLGATVKGKVLLDYFDRNTFGDRITGTVSMVFKVF